jgi:DNA end-binding protein Ku
MKGGAGAYALLRDVLTETGKAGIAKVAMRNREHLAAVKANGPLLVMELMHFAHEISPAEAIKVPAEKKLGTREHDMAKALVDQMSSPWKPEKYKDEYTTALMKLIEKKVKAGGKKITEPKRQTHAATNVVDLVEVLQQSLKSAGGGAGAKRTRAAPKTKKRATPHKHAA